MLLKCTAILFDLDGVLIDSTRCVERHWRHWAQRHSLEAEAILRTAHGVRNIDTMRRIAPHLDLEREAAEFAANEVADTAGVVVVDGARSLLASLEGVPWAVVTSCGAALAQARMQTAGLPLPPLLITGSDVRRGKPDPEPYLVAASRLGAAPSDCVVIEDAPAGMQSGKAAGMRVIGVAFTYQRGELPAGSLDLLIDNLAQLKVLPADGGGLQIGTTR